MIRVMTVLSLTALLVLVLYLPSTHPPKHFIMQMRAEHAQIARFWSAQHAERVLTRALDVQESAREFSPIPNSRDAGDPSAANSAVSHQMSMVNARLFNSPYFRSVDALFLLASYRCFTLLEWLPWVGAFCVAALFDGVVVRAVKARQFAHHDPEMFALYACLALVLACATVMAMVIPATLPLALLPTACVVGAILMAGALAQFHRRA